MSRDIAETLHGIARERRSFIVLAVPRLAGKSTVVRAILAERPASTPVMTLAEDGLDLDGLMKKSAGGYLVIPEITRSAAMPGYIWGADVRRIFDAPKDVSLAATLHAGRLFGGYALGVEISATHHRGARDGVVTGVATPLHLGGLVATYEIVITDSDGQRICTARLTCLLRKP